MLQLSRGHKPARPESRPIQDAHWSLIEQCWSTIDQRPPVKDVVLSLHNFLRFYPIPQPLGDFLGHFPQPDLGGASLSHVTTPGTFLGYEDGMSGSSYYEVSPYTMPRSGNNGHPQVQREHDRPQRPINRFHHWHF